MEADFSGYATKAGLKCTDGRTIMPDAFAHQDKQRVPLVWQHSHDNPTNVLGYAILEHRADGLLKLATNRNPALGGVFFANPRHIAEVELIDDQRGITGSEPG